MKVHMLTCLLSKEMYRSVEMLHHLTLVKSVCRGLTVWILLTVSFGYLVTSSSDAVLMSE